MSRYKYAVLVVFADGDEDYVCVSMSRRVAGYHSKKAAQSMADFLKVGLDAQDSANVVKYPTDAILKAEGYLV